MHFGIRKVREIHGWSIKEVDSIREGKEGTLWGQMESQVERYRLLDCWIQES